MLENKVAETVGVPGMDLVLAPGTGGACGAADKVVLPGHVEQTLVEDGAVPGKVTVRQVVQVLAGSTGFAADLGEETGPAGYNMVPGPESRSLLVPVDHKIPSKQNSYSFSHTVKSSDT